MRKLTWAAFLLAIAMAGTLAQEVETDAQKEQIDSEHAQWIQHVLRSVSTIKPGMTRNRLSRLLDEDGGLQSRTHGRYVYRRCAYIKIDVEFSAVDEETNASPDDKIVTVSKPYLEYPTFD